MRKAVAIVLILLTLLMLVVTLTVPAIAAAGPAILTVALGVAAYMAWPKRRPVQQ